MTIFLLLCAFWLLCIAAVWVWKYELFRRTWKEPYLKQLALLIESDDWGPGGAFHADRLTGLLDMLATHEDAVSRPAVLTADMVLAVPDTTAIRSHDYKAYIRRYLDQGFDGIMLAINKGMNSGCLVPQLHGLEHFYGNGLTRIAAENDNRVSTVFAQDDWWDWESLDSPLQGHYVNGTRLPTSPLSFSEYSETVIHALETFSRLFDINSRSTVAPCYLWNDDVERAWSDNGIRYIQTAGYRCTGRNETGQYIQDPSIIRTGDRNSLGQTYLVRNAMYEPVDGKTSNICITQAMQAYKQGLPVVISTHRYNYTRSENEFISSVRGLDTVLTALKEHTRNIRYLSSSELGDWIVDNQSVLNDPVKDRSWPSLTPLKGIRKLPAFFYRLWYRHKKLRTIVVISGLFIPLYILVMLTNIGRK